MDCNFKFLGKTGFPGAELVPSSSLLKENEVEKAVLLVLMVWAEANEVGRE